MMKSAAGWSFASSATCRKLCRRLSNPHTGAAVGAEPAEQLAHLPAEGAVRRAGVPGVAAVRQEHQPGMFLLLRLGAVGERFLDGLDRLRPQRAAAGDTRLGARVVRPA